MAGLKDTRNDISEDAISCIENILESGGVHMRPELKQAAVRSGREAVAMDHSDQTRHIKQAFIAECNSLEESGNVHLIGDFMNMARDALNEERKQVYLAEANGTAKTDDK